MHSVPFRLFIAIALALLVWAAPAAQAQETAAPGDLVVHVVQPGETLYRIAMRYGTTMTEIAQANQIVNYERIFVGQRLAIPGLTVPTADSAEVVNPLVAAAPITHIVQPGENLTLIAQKYGLTLEQLMQANGLADPNRIMRGQELKVWSAASAEASMAQTASADTAPAIDAAASAPPLPVVGVAPPASSVAQTEALRHIVSYGETLGTIARRYNTTWQEIAAANGIVNIDRITAGQTLVIPGVAAATANASSANLPANASTPPRDMGILTTPANIVPAPPTITVGKQLVVDLSDQMVYAYQDGQLMYSVLGSTGLPATPTVQGDYKIYLRYAEQTMSGPGYWLPGVKWVQYFYQGYAFHTAYWHNNWGQPMSHGCVNLPEEAAKWLYDFATIGTPVHVRY